MDARPFLSLIIPARNEENRLPATLDEVQAFLAAQAYAGEILIVENGSTDRTAEIAEGFARAAANVRLLREPLAGKGRAVRTGMLAATGAFRFMADADLSMPVAEIPRFLPPQTTAYDLVIASREAPGAVRYGEPEYRHIGGRMINGMIRLLALPDFHDTQCGFKLFTAEAAGQLFSRQTLTGWSFDIEILYIARLLGLRVLELPIPWHYRAESKIKPVQDAARMFFDILKVRRNARQGLYR